MAEIEVKVTPPYVPYKTFSVFVDELRGGGPLPHSVDRSVMTRMSGVMQSQLLQSLRFLGLIDEQNEITPLFARLHAASTEDAQKPVMADILKSAYKEITGPLNLQTATPKQLGDRFREIGKIEGDTLEKALRFYVKALSHANVPHSRFLTLRQKRSATKRTASGTDRHGKPEDRQDQPTNNPAPTTDADAQKGMMVIPIYLPGKPLGRVVLPDDLSLDDCDMIDAMLRAVAKRRATK